MEPIRFELTPTQKGMLASWLIETGQPAPTLAEAIVNALEELQDQETQHNGTNGHEAAPQATAVPSAEASKPIWERICETFGNLTEEDLDSLPVDGAAQVDHYVYGLPKR